MTPEDLQVSSEPTSSIMTLIGEVNFFKLKFAVLSDPEGIAFEYAGEFRGNDGLTMAQQWNEASDVIGYSIENDYTAEDIERTLTPIIDRLTAVEFTWRDKSKLDLLFEGAEFDFDYQGDGGILFIIDGENIDNEYVLAEFEDQEDVEVVCSALNNIVRNAFAKKLFFDECADYQESPH